MTRLLLHVGMSKTGSTAVQELLAANRAQLRRCGVTYADVLRGPNHWQLAVAFADRITGLSRAVGVESEADRERLRRRMARRLGRAVRPGSTWVASSEHLSSLLSSRRELEAIAAFLARFFDQVTVLAVLRRADYWLPSSYVEAVKGGSTRPLNVAFVRSRTRFLDHAGFVERWEAAFGTGSVQVLPFLESDKRDGVALPARVLAALGVGDGLTLPAGWALPGGLPNESISAEATELLRLLNPRLPQSALRPTTTRRRVVSFLARQFPGPPTVLTPAAAQALAANGWVDTGIGTSPSAAGAPAAWAAWSAQPAAPVRTLPRLGEDEAAAAYAALQRAGVVPAHRPAPRWERPAVALRRWALRVARY